MQNFADWLHTPQGQYVLAWEQAKFDTLVADIFGFNALQLGLSQHDFLRCNRMVWRFAADPDTQPGTGLVRLAAHELPFASASLDLVILPHVLEFHAAPHQVIREVERVLVPEGSLIISGFNPFSLWGWRRRCTSQQRAQAPWNGHYLSVLRLKDWFALLGLESHSGRFGCYAPPLGMEHAPERWRFMELAGDRWWPYGGAVYVLQAIKRNPGLRLVVPNWRERMARARALASVAPVQPRPSSRWQACQVDGDGLHNGHDSDAC